MKIRNKGDVFMYIIFDVTVVAILLIILFVMGGVAVDSFMVYISQHIFVIGIISIIIVFIKDVVVLFKRNVMFIWGLLYIILHAIRELPLLLWIFAIANDIPKLSGIEEHILYYIGLLIVGWLPFLITLLFNVIASAELEEYIELDEMSIIIASVICTICNVIATGFLVWFFSNGQMTTLLGK